MPSIEDLGIVRSTGSNRFYAYTNKPAPVSKSVVNSTTGRGKRAAAYGNQRTADSATRQRAIRRRLNELDRENYNESHLRYEAPRVDVIIGHLASNGALQGKKKTSKQQSGRSGSTPATRKILASRKTLSNLMDDDPQGARSLSDLAVQPSKYPVKNLCGICGFHGIYSCVKCGLKYCSLTCDLTHKETRCLKMYG